MLPYIEPASDAAGVPKASAADRTRHASVEREKGHSVRIRRAHAAAQKAHAPQGADVASAAPCIAHRVQGASSGARALAPAACSCGVCGVKLLPASPSSRTSRVSRDRASLSQIEP